MTARPRTLTKVKLGALFKALPMALVASALLQRGLGDTLAAGGGFGLTDVSGGAADCPAPTRQAVCATLFDGSSILAPGGPAVDRSVTVTLHGARLASVVGLYLAHVSSRNLRSQSTCTAPDPMAALDLVVSEDGSELYSGTLSEFAREHGLAPDALAARGAGGFFTISVALDQRADNSYMGCVSTADLVWVAAQ